MACKTAAGIVAALQQTRAARPFIPAINHNSAARK
jgi:hypothetical protein